MVRSGPDDRPEGARRESRVVVCIVGFAARNEAGGRPWTIPDGERLPADHPAVRARPDCFVPDGATSSELAMAKESLRRAKEQANPERGDPPHVESSSRMPSAGPEAHGARPPSIPASCRGSRGRANRAPDFPRGRRYLGDPAGATLTPSEGYLGRPESPSTPGGRCWRTCRGCMSRRR